MCLYVSLCIFLCLRYSPIFPPNLGGFVGKKIKYKLKMKFIREAPVIEISVGTQIPCPKIKGDNNKKCEGIINYNKTKEACHL